MMTNSPVDRHDLEQLAQRLAQEPDVTARIRMLRSHSHLRQPVEGKERSLPPDQLAVLLQIVAIGQADVVLRNSENLSHSDERLAQLLDELVVVDRFYDSIGGLVGYHATFLKLLEGRAETEPQRLFHPPGTDITQSTAPVCDAIRVGIDHLPQMAEIYPVGGAGDRLNLCDETTGEALPVACLPFLGRSLLEGLIRDLQGKEALYEHLHGETLVTPIVLMTSCEKDNSNRIRAILEVNNWFGRPQDSFFLCSQCRAPVITEDGIWAMEAPLKLRLKPGGHGVLWKLLEDSGAYDWLHERDRTHALVRQINNPAAGVDYGLLAFTGVGFQQRKQFGFAACHRTVGSAEGMDVLFERKLPDGYAYGISNVEYTDFDAYGIEDSPVSSESAYSRFPSNTNLLFVNLERVREAVESCPLPGLLINLKQESRYLDANGDEQIARAGRLESTMQNIADALTVVTDRPAEHPEQLALPTYVTFNHRHKTISVAKRGYQLDKPLAETPEGSYLNHLRNAYELLQGCGFTCPPLPSEADYLREGPPFHVDFHPALGPLHSVIAQKMRGGFITEGSELQLEITELDIEELQLNGSLLIRATNPLGAARVRLHGVTVLNRGIDRHAQNRFWCSKVARHEALEIVLEGDGECIAHGITFRGAHRIIVPNGKRITALQEGDQVRLVEESLANGPAMWRYRYTDQNQIALSIKQC